MLPLYLKLRNFMSYGLDGGELDLKAIQLACLSGGNGHGKSTLVDAMTWALWGKSRAQREDDLLRQGTTEMEVELHFAAGGALYRVIRKRVLRKSGGAAVLELAVCDNGQFRAITGATIAETERAIMDLLHLSYETFVNSSLLLQGKADSFTVKRPGERKEVLAEILGLQEYESLADRAREKMRGFSATADLLASRIQELDRWVGALPQLELDLQAQDEKIRLSEAQLVEQQAGTADLEARVRAMADLEASLNRQHLRLQQIAADEAEQRAQSIQAEAHLAAADATLAAEPAIRERLGALRSARVESERFGEMLSRLRALDPRREECARAIATEKTRLEGDLTRVRLDLQSAQQATAALRTVRAELVTMRQETAQLETLQAERTRLESDDRALLEQFSGLQAENDTLTRRRAELRKKLESLNGAVAVCPVCNGPLDDAHRDELRRETKAEGMDCKKRMDEIERQSTALKQRQDEIRARVQAIDRRSAALQQQRQRLGALENQAHDLEIKHGTVAVLEAEEARCRGVLEAEAYALEARAALEAVQQQIAAVGYDPDAYGLARRRLQELAPAESEFASLERAREARREAMSSLDAVQVRQDALASERARLEQERAPLLEATRALPEARMQLAQLQHNLQEERVRHAALLQHRGSLVNQLEYGRRMEAERVTALRGRDEANKQAWAHRELSVIFGKTGIQAMLIENALPELEQYANEMLARMTDNSTQVNFVTRRGTKTGSAIETLDIRIADNMGTRTYEMFSGGEAFRINLAIRIALSKLLARRAGADLSFLLIDEGFGSQDSLGRDRLVEAISAIADDFQKILVVTHIDELKDLFEVHIEISKGPGGSQISVTAA